MALEMGMYILLSASLVATLLLTIHIAFRGLKSPAAFYYFLFMLTVIAHVCGDLFFQLSWNMRDALFWLIPYWVGFFFMAPLFFLFSMAFPRPRKICFQDEKAKLIMMLFPLFLTYVLIVSRDFVKTLNISSVSLNKVIYGDLYFLVIAYLATFLGMGFWILYKEYRKTNVKSDAHNIEMVFAGTFIAAFFGVIGDAFLIRFLGFGELKLASVFMLFSAIVIGYAVVRHKIFNIEPVSEDIVQTKMVFNPEEGKIYSFDEKNDSRKRAFRIFADLVKHNRQGLLISTIYPNQIRKMYNLPKTPMFWLTESSDSAVKTVKPNDIDALDRSVCLFIDKATNPIVLIEGINSLVTENGSEKVVEFLDSISSKAKESMAIIFFSINEGETSFMHIFNEVNSLKSDLKDLSRRYYSRELGEEAYIELVEDVEKKIIEKEAKFRVMEEEMLGKLNGLTALEKQKILLEKSLQIINHKLGKRSIDQRVGVALKKEIQKSLVESDQVLRKKNLVEDY